MQCFSVKYTSAALWVLLTALCIKHIESKIKTVEELPKPLKLVANLQKALYAQDYGYSIAPIPNQILKQIKPTVASPRSENARMGRQMGRGFVVRRPGRSRRKRPYRMRSSFGLPAYASAYKHWMPYPMRRPMGGRRPLRFKGPPKMRPNFFHTNFVEPPEDYLEPEVVPDYEDEYEVMMEPETMYDPEEVYDDMPRSPSRNVYSYQRDEEFLSKHADLYTNGFNPGYKSRSHGFRPPSSIIYSSKYRSPSGRDIEESPRDAEIEPSSFESDAPLPPMALRGSPELYKRSKKEDLPRYQHDEYRSYKDSQEEARGRMNDGEVIMGRIKSDVPSWTGSVKFIPRPFTTAAIGSPSRTVVPRDKLNRFTDNYDDRNRDYHDKDYLYDYKNGDSSSGHRLASTRDRTRVYRSNLDRPAYRKPSEDSREAHGYSDNIFRLRDPDQRKHLDEAYTQELQELYSRGHPSREYDRDREREDKKMDNERSYLANHRKDPGTSASQGMEIVIDDGVAGWKVNSR